VIFRALCLPVYLLDFRDNLASKPMARALNSAHVKRLGTRIIGPVAPSIQLNPRPATLCDDGPWLLSKAISAPPAVRYTLIDVAPSMGRRLYKTQRRLQRDGLKTGGFLAAAGN